MGEDNLFEKQAGEFKSQSLRELCKRVSILNAALFTLSALKYRGFQIPTDDDLRNDILNLIDNDYMDDVINAFATRLTIEKRPIIISGYPGVGKTTFKNRYGEILKTRRISNFKISDSDSSHFSWTTDADGNKIRNPEFPGNYIQHIKDLMNEYQIILVSTHKQVRDAMDEAGIDYYIVYPGKDFPKKEYMKRFRERGSSEDFIKVQDENWDKWIDDLNNDQVHIGYSLDPENIPCLDISVIAGLSYIESKLNEVPTRKAFLEKIKKGE